MNRRTYGTVGAVAVVLVAAVAAVSAGGVTLGGGAPAGSATPSAIAPAATAAPGESTDAAAGNATTIDHEGAHLTLSGAPNQTVRGETDLSPGTSVAVRLVSEGTDSPFIVQQTTTVGEGGEFSATFDLAHVSEDASAWATVVRDGVELENVSARIAAVEGVTPTDGGEGSESGRGTQFVHEGDRLTLAALENETVRGETDLAPGSEVTVRLTSTAGASPFLVQRTATVAGNGTFAATVDLVGVANGTEFTATVRRDGETLATVEGVVIGGKNEAQTVNTSDGNWTKLPVNETSRVVEDDHNTTLDYDGDRLTLASAPGQTVAGETDLPAGTNVTLRIESTAAEDPFLRSTTATVTGDGRFSAAVDLGDVPAGATFEVVVRHDGDTLAVADGEVVE